MDFHLTKEQLLVRKMYREFRGERSQAPGR